MNQSTPAKASDRRERLVDAVAAEIVEVGYGALSVKGITSRAGVSRGSFYSHFANRQAAVAAAYECLFERYRSRLLQTCRAQSSWPLKVKVGIGATLDMVAAAPVEAQFVAAKTMSPPDEFRLLALESRDRLARLLAAGRTESPHGAELPGVTEASLVGGLAWVILAQLRAGEGKHLPALAPELVELTLIPYLGREEAAKVARRSRPTIEDG